MSRKQRNQEKFCEHIRSLVDGCFVPITAGGGICNTQQANELLRSGADKIVVNSILAENPLDILDFASHFGSQCIVVSVDIKHINGEFIVFTHNGEVRQDKSLKEWLESTPKTNYLNHP